MLEDIKSEGITNYDTEPSTNVETEVVILGVEIKRNAITKEEQLELFNILKPYIEQQGAKTNKATSANVMIGLGLRWDYKSNNPNYKSIEIKNIIVPGSSAKYGYYEVSINGQPLGPINPRIKTLMSKATGIDATDYDGAIINLYTDKTFISAHNDVDEAADAIGYPVLVLNIGGSGNFSVQQTGKYEPTPLNSGDSYVFGINGENRKVMHRTFPSKQDGFLPAITTAIDGETYSEGSYRLSITLRRVKNLEPGMPTVPAKITTQPFTSVEIKTTDIEKDSIENDLAVYRATVSENNGELPKSFMVNDKRLWQLYKNGNYNLVDSVTGEIYMRNVNMTTGKEEVEPELNEPLDPELKEVAINQILFGIENQDYEERLAELGYDVKDILNNLAKAKTKADYNKILKIIDKLC
jgi:hypothetical protein